MSSYIKSAASCLARTFCCCCSSNSSKSTQQVYQINPNETQSVQISASVSIQVKTAARADDHIQAARPQFSRSPSAGKAKEYSAALSPEQRELFMGDDLPGELIEQAPIAKRVAQIAVHADDDFSQMNISPLGSPDKGRSEAVSKAVTPYRTSPNRSPSSSNSREKQLRIAAVAQASAPLHNSPVDEAPPFRPGSHPFQHDLPRLVQKRLSILNQNQPLAMPASVAEVAQASKPLRHTFTTGFGQQQVALRSGKKAELGLLPRLKGAAIPAVAPLEIQRPRPLGRYSISVTVNASDNENN